MKKNSGFITAEFLFAFTLVIGCGILIFVFTFTLTSLEIAQYITWSSARSYAVGNLSEAESIKAGKSKFKKLSALFPLLTGEGNSSPWLYLNEDPLVGSAVELNIKTSSSQKNIDSGQQIRHSWDGVSGFISLNLLSGLRIPFLGRIVPANETITMYVRSHLMRHPSQKECYEFFADKFSKGVLNLKTPKNLSSGGSEPEWKNLPPPANALIGMIEDNGC